MADKNSIVALNIGAQRVGMARFKNTKGQLVLSGYESTEILADPAAANSRNAQIKMAVLELAHRMDVKDRVSYAVSGQSVFTRFVLLPNLDGVGIEELVTAEAQQNIPFSLDEVKWDWQEVIDVDGEKEVVIAAIKSKVLNDIQDAVEGAGMFTTEVDPSPMALYNAFRYSYPDVNEPCMLLDIGAKTSNVIYIDGKRVFCRSVAIGGSTVTSAIAKEYNVSFTEAENQKKSNGMVALDTRHTSKLDELTAALAACIRTSLNRMPAEIARTTNYYRSQQGGSAPKRVFLSGGGANLPKMSSFLQEKLRLPVEFFNPLRTLTVAKGVDLDVLAQEAHLMGELVGLAVRRSGQAHLKLDLVPDSVAKEKDIDKRKSKLLIGASCFAAGLFLFWCFGLVQNSSLKAAKRQLDEDYAKYKPIADKMDAKIAHELQAIEDVKSLMKSQEDRTHWVSVIDELKEVYCKKGYWITEVKPLVNYSPETLTSAVTARINFGAKTDEPLAKEAVGDIVNAVYIRGTWLKDSHGIAETTNKWLGPELTEEEIIALERNRPLAAGEEAPVKPTAKHFSRILQYKGNTPKSAKSKIEKASIGGDVMFKLKPQWDEGKIGSDFTIVLPLANPIEVPKPVKRNPAKK